MGFEVIRVVSSFLHATGLLFTASFPLGLPKLRLPDCKAVTQTRFSLCGPWLGLSEWLEPIFLAELFRPISEMAEMWQGGRALGVSLGSHLFCPRTVMPTAKGVCARAHCSLTFLG